MHKEFNLELATHETSSKSLQIIAAALIGLVVLGVTAFAPMDVIHNATHDTRHSTGFPCH